MKRTMTDHLNNAEWTTPKEYAEMGGDIHTPLQMYRDGSIKRRARTGHSRGPGRAPAQCWEYCIAVATA